MRQTTETRCHTVITGNYLIDTARHQRWSRATEAKGEGGGSPALGLAIGPLVRQLMDSLVRKPEELRGVACAHLQTSTLQHPNGTPRRGRCSAVVLVCLLPQPGVGADRFPGIRQQLDVLDNLRRGSVVNEQSHGLSKPASSLVHRTPLRVASSQFANG